VRGLVQLGMEGNAVRNKRGTIGPLMFAVVGLLILLPILYGLSTGPVMWLSCKGYLSNDSVTYFYSPLDFLCEHCEPLSRLILWYEDLFMCPPQPDGPHNQAVAGA
jgi:hypothetical protein